MGREEQLEEREVLEAIFADELTHISDVSDRISIALEVPVQDDVPLEPVVLWLTVTYPSDYPEKAPLLELAAPPNAPKHAYFDIQADKEELLSALGPTVEENIGMQMTFTLVSTLKDHAETLIAARVADVQALKEAEAAKAEELENAKFHGERVTRESFLAWRETFRAEMQEEELRRREVVEGEEKKKGVKKEERLTGRMLWERGLIVAGEEEGDGEAEIPKDVGRLTVRS